MSSISGIGPGNFVAFSQSRCRLRVRSGHSHSPTIRPLFGVWFMKTTILVPGCLRVGAVHRIRTGRSVDPRWMSAHSQEQTSELIFAISQHGALVVHSMTPQFGTSMPVVGTVNTISCGSRRLKSMRFSLMFGTVRAGGRCAF